MIVLLLALIFATGTASQYAPGVMDRVIVNRLAFGHITQDQVDAATVFVAVPECADLGQMFLIRPVGASDWELALATDCASKSDRQSADDPRSGYQWMRDGGIVVELDARTAARWDTVGRGIAVELARWTLVTQPGRVLVEWVGCNERVWID